MLYLKASEEKKLTFEVDIHGVECSDLKGYVRFEIYGAEYGFPAEIERNKITAIVPPLTEIVKKDIEDGTVIQARLEMFTDRHYFSPWSGEVKVGAPMDIRATLKDEAKGPGIKTRLLTSESEEPKNEIKKKEEKSIDSESVKNMIFEVLNEMKGTTKGGSTTKKKSGKITKDYLRNITEEGIIRYIEKAGTKNKEVQRVILEKARAAAGSSDNFKVLKEVVNIMKKKRG